MVVITVTEFTGGSVVKFRVTPVSKPIDLLWWTHFNLKHRPIERPEKQISKRYQSFPVIARDKQVYME